MPVHLRSTAAAAAAVVAITAIVVTLLITPWSAAPSSGSDVIQGDVECDRDVDSVDALFDLRFVADLEPFGECTAVAGDTDCNGKVEATDGLHILRFVGGFESTAPASCTPVGEPVDGAPTPAGSESATPAASSGASATASASPSDTIMPTVTTTATATPTVTPTPGSFELAHVLQDADYDRMIDFAVIPDTGDQEAVVITQHGLLWRLSRTEAFAPEFFGDISDIVNCCGEQGLLSIAFSPNTNDDLVYLYYTRSDAGDACSGSEERCSFISRFTVSGNQINSGPDVVLEVAQPFSNHNGGKLLFDAQGFLYLGLGDGGGAFDTEDNGQDKDTLLGTVIRIDVSGPGAYTIPGDNPFFGQAGADEIWAYGLRNPWRMSFDRLTGDLWLADVGQGAWEEVDLIVKGGNYGWVCFEGNVAGDPNAPNCPPAGPVEFPRAVYPNDDPDCAVVGGYVYRGSQLPELDGWYIFGDNCSGRIRAYDTSGSEPPIILVDGGPPILSLAELPNGEILVLAFDDSIYQLVRS